MLMGLGSVAYNGFLEEVLNLLFANTGVGSSTSVSEFASVKGVVFAAVTSKKLCQLLVVSFAFAFCKHSAITSAD